MTSVPHSGAKSVTPGGSVAGHTPGPWRAKSGSTPYPECDDADSWIAVVSPAGREVITLYERYSLAPDDRGCWEADARLIAAAPELLAVVQLVRMSFGWQTLSEETKALLDEAIAKATAGETRNAEPIHRRDGDEG